ncbi:glycosyltransferase [Clostridium sp. AL.422]|uniref:MGDG synthase family glycosyltransferase n=1 Tax=Clostridium TaxID=1485 RepID=UPI00293DE2D6|nr:MULTISPECIES: glycosyltransferase [unclassified Clostridium]MDV4151579.1 glycosyltransferase [Clostridium sp. AL.422]
MKKILILTTSTGEGHNQAAKSITTTFEESGYEVITHDFLKNNSKFLTKLFITGYEVSAAFFPKTYGIAYNITDKEITNKLLSFVFSMTKRKIKRLVDTAKPDIILVTHPFAVSIIGALKRKGLDIPTIVIVTDFKAHSTYIDTNIDAYITASENTKTDLSIRGIDSSKIFSYGIPVKDEFSHNELDIKSTKDDDYFNILLMSGSMGLKNISYVLKELLNNSNKLRITVVCGKNESLKDSLLKEYNNSIKNKKLHILGFSKDIDYLMEYSDLIISKPGGLTVTEAINKHLPLLIPFAIPGQETQNVEFLTSNGYALYIDNLLEINLIIDNLISNPKELEKMRLNLSKLSSLYSKKNIVKLADKLVLKK